MEDRFWSSFRPCSERYEYLETIGQVDVWTPLPRERDNRYRFYGPIAGSLPINARASIDAMAGPYYRVVGTVSSVEMSIKKMDKKPVRSYQQDPLWDDALEFVCRKFHRSFSTCGAMSTEYALSTMVLGASSGQPWALLGMKHKRDCLKSKLFQEYLTSDCENMAPPVWKITPKTEWYPAEKLDANKCRTFIIPPFHLLFWQKMLYQKQNESVKNVFWSAYGFNPYRGGVDAMASRLLRNKVFLYYDVVGWDRVLPIMQEVYNFRNIYIPDHLARIAEWVTRNTVESVLLHPDGYLLKKKWGNNSGSGCTTTDNIVAHCFILSLALLTLYKTPTVVDLVEAFIFGDDNVLSLPESSHSDSEIQAVFERVFGSFGLSFDPFTITRDLSTCEFLGFKFQPYGDHWIPRYNLERIASSFLYSYEKRCPMDAEVSKMFILMIMAAGSGRDVYRAFKEVVGIVLNDRHDTTDPVVKSFVDVGIPTYSQVMAFYTGAECFSWSEVVEKYFYSDEPNFWDFESNEGRADPLANHNSWGDQALFKRLVDGVFGPISRQPIGESGRLARRGDSGIGGSMHQAVHHHQSSSRS